MAGYSVFAPREGPDVTMGTRVSTITVSAGRVGGAVLRGTFRRSRRFDLRWQAEQCTQNVMAQGRSRTFPPPV